jgi:hypothetical protein
MFKGGCDMANTGTLCISIIILVIVIILIVMVCYNYNQTQTTQPYIQNPGLAAAAAYRYKNNFAKGRRRAKGNFGNPTCAPNTVVAKCNTNGQAGICAFGDCIPII